MNLRRCLVGIVLTLALFSSLEIKAWSNPTTTLSSKAVLTAEKVSEQSDSAPSFSGNASWYGIPFHGHKTASGEIFDMNKLSAAHKTLPFPTKILVENPRNGQSAVIRVIDRGPYVRGRVLDLSREAARRVGTFPGVGYVEATVLSSKATSQDKK